MSTAFNKARIGWLTFSMATRLVAINVLVFIVIRIGDIVCTFSGTAQDSWLHLWMMPSFLPSLVAAPWTVVTYMFSQFDVLHCLFNLLWLYSFSRMFLMFSTPRQLVGLYVMSGLAGAVAFLFGMNLLPAMQHTAGWLIGSSAAVMGIVAAAGMMMPDMPVRLFLIGDVKLKWIAVAALVLFVVCGDPSNAGGQMAHIGGALMGLVYGLRMRKGRDITRPFNSMADSIVNLFGKMSFKNRAPRAPKVKPFKAGGRQGATSASTKQDTSISREDQDALDAILDKIKQSGYSALSTEEKRRLFEVSKRIK